MTECEEHYIGLINNLDGGNQGTPWLPRLN
jgi:hypothetical protein